MALIKCPHCGQDVSDKAKTCPHCGKEINDSTHSLPTKNYNDLKEADKKRLVQEFVSSYPSYDYQKAELRSEKYKRITVISSTLGWILFAVFLIMMIVVGATDTETPFVLVIAFIGIFGAASGATCFIVCKVLSVKAHHRYLLSMRIYQAWLSRDKGIVFQAAFNRDKEQDRKYFENIPIEMYLNQNKGE